MDEKQSPLAAIGAAFTTYLDARDRAITDRLDRIESEQRRLFESLSAQMATMLQALQNLRGEVTGMQRRQPAE